MATIIKSITSINFTNLDRLDPVTLYLDDIAPGEGSIIIKCFSSVWFSYWGGMGNYDSVLDFFKSCDSSYLSNALWDHHTQKNNVMDYDLIGKEIGETVCENSWFYHLDKIHEKYEHDIPQITAEDYLYLKRIVEAVLERLGNEQSYNTLKEGIKEVST